MIENEEGSQREWAFKIGKGQSSVGFLLKKLEKGKYASASFGKWRSRRLCGLSPLLAWLHGSRRGRRWRGLLRARGHPHCGHHSQRDAVRFLHVDPHMPYVRSMHHFPARCRRVSPTGVIPPPAGARLTWHSSESAPPSFSPARRATSAASRALVAGGHIQTLRRNS